MIKEIDGVQYGIYTDDNGNEFIVKSTCPHLGCGLVFNSIDKTYVKIPKNEFICMSEIYFFGAQGLIDNLKYKYEKK